jgi:RNA polymerase sigma factor for flagellar operon FliA
MVKAIALRLHQGLPIHVELDDLVHTGILGLFSAASKYDPEKNVMFATYAKHRIKGAILDGLRQLDWASRDMRRRLKQVETATHNLATRLQRVPTESEISDELKVDLERLRALMVDLRDTGLVSSSSRASEKEDLPAPEFPDKIADQPDYICAQVELRGTLYDAIRTLPQRYQKIVRLYYGNEMTMKEIGCVLGINESRVSQIHKSALGKMAVGLGAVGVTSSHAF